MIADGSKLNRAKRHLLELALTAQGDRPDLLYRLAELCLDEGAFARGASLYRQAYLAQPEIRPSPILDWVDDPEVVQQVHRRTSSLITEGVAYSSVIWAKLVASARMGNHGEVAALTDYDLFFQQEIAPFPEAADPAFMDGLATEIRSGMRHYSIDGWTAIKQASRNSDIMNCGLPYCEILSERLIEKVRDYTRKLRASNRDIPQISNIPGKAAISAWCVLLNGQSRHISHIHPRAWLSGVFYVTRPQPIGASRKGWFRSGPPAAIASDTGWNELWVEPKPGTLALMPAYFSHETVPTGSDEERMCVAFDVMSADLSETVDGAKEFELS